MARREYGLVGEVGVSYKRHDGFVTLWAVILDGSDKRINAFLSKRAAYTLWYRLTQELYPDDSPTAAVLKGGTGILNTPDGQSLTSQLEVTRLANGFFEVVGFMMSAQWAFRISQTEARRVWGALDVLLFPYDWEGRETYAGDQASAPSP